MAKYKAQHTKEMFIDMVNEYWDKLSEKEKDLISWVFLHTYTQDYGMACQSYYDYCKENKVWLAFDRSTWKY